LLPRSGLERSDFVPWPDAADRLDRTERQLRNEDRPRWSTASQDRI
jgi:hypothetical protein